MKKTEYIIHKVESEIVYLIDPDDGNVSITNMAEEVVKEINDFYPNHRVVYLDTNREWWELLHEDGNFKGYLEYKISK